MNKYREGIKRMEFLIPDELHVALVERARRNKRSLKAEIIFTLEKSAAAPKRSIKTKDPG